MRVHFICLNIHKLRCALPTWSSDPVSKTLLCVATRAICYVGYVSIIIVILRDNFAKSSNSSIIYSKNVWVQFVFIVMLTLAQSVLGDVSIQLILTHIL
ncbi:unnamed protein product [Tenebrio molitor]|jgi:hypothetical protein|nr:unnamed protein product [Tenebrio molitor]